MANDVFLGDKIIVNDVSFRPETELFSYRGICMSSIGLIVVEKRELKELPQNWVPIPLGPRPLVQNLVEKSLLQNEHLALEMTIEGVEESADPRTISVSGVWGVEEMLVIKSICSQLGARFYDAESGEFLDLNAI